MTDPTPLATRALEAKSGHATPAPPRPTVRTPVDPAVVAALRDGVRRWLERGEKE